MMRAVSLGLAAMLAACGGDDDGGGADAAPPDAAPIDAAPSQIVDDTRTLAPDDILEGTWEAGPDARIRCADRTPRAGRRSGEGGLPALVERPVQRARMHVARSRQ